MKLNTKNKFLIVSIIVMTFVVYKFALSKTIAEATANENLKTTIQTKRAVLKEKTILEKQNVVYDSVLKNHNVASSSLQNQLLNVLTDKSKELDVKLLAFNEPHKISKDQSTTKTYMFTLEGGFVNLLNILHALESNYSFGETSHVAFKRVKDLRTKAESLEVTCFITVKEF